MYPVSFCCAFVWSARNSEEQKAVMRARNACLFSAVSNTITINTCFLYCFTKILANNNLLFALPPFPSIFHDRIEFMHACLKLEEVSSIFKLLLFICTFVFMLETHCSSFFESGKISNLLFNVSFLLLKKVPFKHA